MIGKVRTRSEHKSQQTDWLVKGKAMAKGTVCKTYASEGCSQEE